MKTYQVERRELVERSTAVVRSTLSIGEIGQFIGHALGAVAQALAGQGTAPAGPPFARYHRLDGQRFDVEAGFPTVSAASPTAEVSASSLPGGAAAVLTYIGPYDEMEPAYAALAEWVARNGGHPAGDPWEVYFSDPAREPDPRTWRTEIVMPFRT